MDFKIRYLVNYYRNRFTVHGYRLTVEKTEELKSIMGWTLINCNNERLIDEVSVRTKKRKFFSGG